MKNPPRSIKNPQKILKKHPKIPNYPEILLKTQWVNNSVAGLILNQIKIKLGFIIHS